MLREPYNKHKGLLREIDKQISLWLEVEVFSVQESLQKLCIKGFTHVWICTMLNPEGVQYVCRSRYKSCASRDSCMCGFVQLRKCSSQRLCEDGLKGTGYFLDKELSDKQHTVFYNSTAKKAIVPFIGIDVRVPDWILSDL